MEVIYLRGDKHEFDIPIVSALGFFDGLHIGHMELVNKVISVSKEKGYKSCSRPRDGRIVASGGIILWKPDD